MTRIDWLILKRLMSRIAVTVLVLFGLIALAESLNTWRYSHFAAIGGPLLVILAVAVNAAAWLLQTLPVTLLIGSIIGILDLEARRELTVVKAAGISVWRMLRAPVAAVILLGFGVSLVGDTAVVMLTRALSINLPDTQSTGGTLWLEQQGDGHDYVLVAEHPHPGGTVLDDVTMFLPAELSGPRIEAPRIELRNAAWYIAEGIRFAPDTIPSPIRDLSIPTSTLPGDLGARLASPSDLTIFELIDLQSRQISDPVLENAVGMRLMRLLSLPLALAASLLIAFAFTAGYRRTNKYGATVLYGIVLGFVVYVVTEMAAIAGSAGILQPAFAAFAPAFVAMVVGTTVLLYREDGRR